VSGGHLGAPRFISGYVHNPSASSWQSADAPAHMAGSFAAIARRPGYAHATLVVGQLSPRSRSMNSDTGSFVAVGPTGRRPAAPPPPAAASRKWYGPSTSIATGRPSRPPRPGRRMSTE
jgi:hypothetical protein